MVGVGGDVQKLPVVQKSRQKYTKSTPLSMQRQFLTNDRHVYAGIDLIIFIFYSCIYRHLPFHSLRFVELSEHRRYKTSDLECLLLE